MVVQYNSGVAAIFEVITKLFKRMRQYCEYVIKALRLTHNETLHCTLAIHRSRESVAMITERKLKSTISSLWQHYLHYLQCVK